MILFYLISSVIISITIKSTNGYLGSVYFEPCETVKESKLGTYMSKNVNYTPICKASRPDLYENVQYSNKLKFCVNVTTGQPLLLTMKPKLKSIDCAPNKFSLKLAITNGNKSSITHFDTYEIRQHLLNLGFVKVWRTKIIALKNSNHRSWQMFMYELLAVGETNKVYDALLDAKREGEIGRMKFKSLYSRVERTKNLPDPPPVPFDPNNIDEWKKRFQKSKFSKKSPNYSNNPSSEYQEPNDSENNKNYYSGNPSSSQQSSDKISVNNVNKSSSGYVAGIVFAVFGIIAFACLIVLYCIYRLRKKDEGSYSLNRVMLTTNKISENNMNNNSNHNSHHYGNGTGHENNQFLMTYNTKEYFA